MTMFNDVIKSKNMKAGPQIKIQKSLIGVKI